MVIRSYNVPGSIEVVVPYGMLNKMVSRDREHVKSRIISLSRIYFATSLILMILRPKLHVRCTMYSSLNW